MTVNLPSIKYTPQSCVKTAGVCLGKNSQALQAPSFGSSPSKQPNFIKRGFEAFTDKIVSLFPKEMDIKKDKTISWVTKIGGWSTPENRLVLGATAMATQPWIDLNNKDTDEETRKVSCCRTIAKIIAGTTVGYFVRKGCIGAIAKLTDVSEASKKKASEISQLLVPDKVKDSTTGLFKKITPEQFADATRLVKKHRQTIGSFAALFVMLITNFALDVPITKFLTNVFVEKVAKPNQAKPEEKGGR